MGSGSAVATPALTAAEVLAGMSREDAVAALERIAQGLPPM